MIQKFQIGDMVKLDKPSVEGYTVGVVEFSYAQKFNALEHFDHYSLIFKNGSIQAWFHESELNFIKNVGQKHFKKIIQKANKRAKKESKIKFIRKNWAKWEKTGIYPNSALEKLGKIIGLNSLRGAIGDVTTYQVNCRTIIHNAKNIMDYAHAKRIK